MANDINYKSGASETPLYNMIKYIFDNYVESRFEDNGNQKSFTNNPFGVYLKNDATESLYEIDFLDSEKYKTDGSIGRSQWADVCWVAIFDKRITTSASKGEYVVYLISKDGKSIYLSLIKAATGNNSDDLEKWARYVVNKMGQNKFECDTSKMDLGPDPSGRAKSYIKGTAFYKEYKIDQIPDEDELEDDLQCMLDLYQDYIDIFRVDENGEIKDFQFDDNDEIAKDICRRIDRENDQNKKNKEANAQQGEFMNSNAKKEITDTSNVKYWLIKDGGSKHHFWEDFYEDGIVAIGWGELGNLSEKKDQDEIKDLMKQIDPNHNHKKEPIAKNLFVNRINPDDIVYIRSSTKTIVGRGIVESNYYFEESQKYGGFSHRRKVRWTHNGSWQVPSSYSPSPYDTVIQITDDLISQFENLFEEERVKGGANILYYGVPGSGKSYAINDQIGENEREERMERVIFHPDYTYSDFVGQILPKLVPIKDNSDEKKLTYEFVPGPFTRILKKAVDDRNNMYYLVIEEINRGNAPAIFGDIFQLLDRNKDGSGEYPITNSDIAREVYNDENQKVKMPSNLTIYATMNTSDQNVFTLDTAFQRRWQMKQVRNDVKNADHADKPIDESSDITWGGFATVINEKIIDSNKSMISSEDKRLGAYFVKEDELGKGNSEKFAEKVLKYLWDDAFKMNRQAVFIKDITTLEDLIDNYIKASKASEDPFKKIFTEGVYKDMNDMLEQSGQETNQTDENISGTEENTETEDIETEDEEDEQQGEE